MCLRLIYQALLDRLPSWHDNYMGKEMSEVKGVILWAEQMNDPISTKPEAECW